MSRRTFIVWALVVTVLTTRPTSAGVYEDLGRPVIGAWRQGAWVYWDPVLERDLLWSQECSQEGAVLYAVDLETGGVVIELDVPAREISNILSTADGTLYVAGVSGLTQPGNELLRFDPQSRKLARLGFPHSPRNRIASLLIGHDGNIYVGTHQEGRLFRFRPTANSWDELGQMVPSPVRERQNVWLRLLRQQPDGTIFASVVRSPSQLVAIDPQNGQFHEVSSTDYANERIASKGFREYTNDRLREYDTEFRVKSETTYRSLQGGAGFGSDAAFELVSVDEESGPLLRVGLELVRAQLGQQRLQKLGTLPFAGLLRFTSDGDVVVIDTRLARFAVVNLGERGASILPIKYRGKRGTQICGLNKASDGSIYGSNIIGMHLFRHDPRTDQTADLGHVGWPGGEVYNTIDVGGRIYFGTYGGGYWGVYDPARPWNPDWENGGTSTSANPRNLGRLGGDDPNAVNRPFEYVLGANGKIYIAARANYRSPGGALVEFDTESNSARVFRDLKRSVQTVTADQRYVFAGTNIHGGRGSGDRAKVATLFVHDPGTGTRIFENAVVPESKAIVCLRYCPSESLVYGSTDNQVLFAFDPRTFEVRSTWKIRSPGSPLAGVPEDVGMIHLTVATDGNIYGVTRSDLFRLNVAAGVIEYLDPPPIPDLYQIVEGHPGEFFLGARSHLLKYRVETPVYFR